MDTQSMQEEPINDPLYSISTKDSADKDALDEGALNSQDKATDISEESLIPSNLLTDLPKELSESKDSCAATTPLTHPQEIDINYFLYTLRTHQGSLYSQYLLDRINDTEVNSLLTKLFPFLIELMCSHYGNYFIQKLFQKINLKQRLLVLQYIQYQFIPICTNRAGTHSIQSLIDAMKTEREEMLLQSLLCQNLLLFFCNKNAHHIIQKIIIDFPEHKRQYINAFLIQNIEEICSNEYGSLCVIKFFLMNNNLYIRLELLRAINQKIFSLISNQFGCSVLMFILDRFDICYSRFIINAMRSNLLYLSTLSQVSIPLIEKSLGIMKRYDTVMFNEMASEVLQSAEALALMKNFSNGKKILHYIIKNSTGGVKNMNNYF